MKFVYYYKMYNGDTEVHVHEIYAANQEAANLKWYNYKKLHDIVDVTSEEKKRKEETVHEERN